MTGSEILALYDAEMRADPPRDAGVRHERVGSVVRSVGLWSLVLFWTLSESEAAAAVSEQAAFARSAGIALEWKLYAHDGPAGLSAVLERAGFVPDETETFMVFDLARDLPDSPVYAGLDIVPVVDAVGVDDFIAVGDAAFGKDNRAKAETYVRSLRDAALTLFVAYLDGRPVSAGRLQTPKSRSFASIWGGGTVPRQRRQGIYRALVARRAHEARRRGYRYITVDAADTSRPILERLGFVPITTVTGWVLHG